MDLLKKFQDIKEARPTLRNTMLTKDVQGHLKDVDGVQGIVTGYFSTKNVKDSHMDIIVDGAYKKSIEQRGPSGTRQIKTLYQHDPTKLLATPSVLLEDDFGLYYENTISQTALGKDVIKLISDGVITEHSIGFNLIDYEFSEDDDAWLLKELKLFEGSYVTWGANSVTPITSIKSNDTTALIAYIDNINNSLRKGTWHSDEIPTMFEIFAKQMRPLILELQSKADSRPVPDTIEKSTDPDPVEIEPQFTLADIWKSELEKASQEAEKTLDLRSIWEKQYEELAEGVA